MLIRISARVITSFLLKKIAISKDGGVCAAHRLTQANLSPSNRCIAAVIAFPEFSYVLPALLQSMPMIHSIESR